MRQVAWLREWLAFVVLLVVVAAMVAVPATVTATSYDGRPAYQGEALEPGAAAAEAGLVEVARIVRSMKGGDSAPQVQTQSVQLTPTPTPAAMLPTPTPAPAVIEPPVEKPTPVATPSGVDTAEYSNEGVTLKAPGSWIITPGDFGSVFNIEIPDTDFLGVVQSMGAEDFPGLMGIVLFKTQADTLVGAIDPGGELLGVDSFFTEQGLPLVKIALSADMGGGEVGTGAFYIVSTGLETYGIYGFAAPADWPQIESGLDLMAGSLVFDPDMITLEAIKGGLLEYVDEENGLRLTVPDGWLVSPTGDVDVPVVLADSGLNLAAMLSIAPGSPADEGLDVTELLQGGAADAQTSLEMVQTVLDMMDLPSDEFVQDETLTQAFPGDDSVVLRFGGDIAIEDFGTIPLAFYLSLTEEKAAVLVLMGEAETMLAVEPTLLDLLNSLERLE